jgi:hypothetical protein
LTAFVIASQRVGAKRRPVTRSNPEAIKQQLDCFVAEFIIGPAKAGPVGFSQ